MNKQRLAELADVIEKAPDKWFDMDRWIQTEEFGAYNFPRGAPIEFKCGTVACIAGWAVIHFDKKLPEEKSIADRAQDILGLGNNETRSLFMGHWSDKDTDAISKAEAVARLRELAK